MAEAPGTHVGICRFITSSLQHPFKGREGTMSACVPQCLCFCTCVTERLRESLSKLIRWGIRIEVKYWATCNERSREGGGHLGVRPTPNSGPQAIWYWFSLVWGWRWTGVGSQGKRQWGLDREKEREKEGTKGLLSCQLDSLTPFGGEQTNRGISWADSVDLS